MEDDMTNDTMNDTTNQETPSMDEKRQMAASKGGKVSSAKNLTPGARSKGGKRRRGRQNS